jgi:nucleoside-diphosphate-sugar epimerase
MESKTAAERESVSVLLLGGCGFVGRNFLLFLLNEQLVSYVKVVDKMTPLMAFMHPLHLACFDSSLVEFQQADLTQYVFFLDFCLPVSSSLDRPDHLERVFHKSSSPHWNASRGCQLSFDYVFNLAAETRFDQPEYLYSSRCTDLSRFCALMSAECRAKRFIEVNRLLLLSFPYLF